MSINKLNYHHKKIDLIVINDQDISDFLFFKKGCHHLHFCTSEIMVVILCKRNAIRSPLISHILELLNCSFLTIYALCLNSVKELKIFTINPFTNREVSNWKKIKLRSRYLKMLLGPRITIYYQLYKKSNVIHIKF